MNDTSFHFTKTLKLYYFREKKLVSLSILASPTQVMTFYFNSDVFDRIISECTGPNGIESKPYFIHRKKAFFRFTYDSVDGMQTNLRVDNKKWDALVTDYRSKKDSSKAPIETCIVD